MKMRVLSDKCLLYSDYDFLHFTVVLAYLVMFRLEELEMGHFKRLVNTQHTGKMHKVGGVSLVHGKTCNVWGCISRTDTLAKCTV